MNWKEVEGFIKVKVDLPEVKWAKPGTENGLKMLESFVKSRLKHFATDRNDPTKVALSNLSPWFHSGNYFIDFRSRFKVLLSLLVSHFFVVLLFSVFSFLVVVFPSCFHSRFLFSFLVLVSRFRSLSLALFSITNSDIDIRFLQKSSTVINDK